MHSIENVIDESLNKVHQRVNTFNKHTKVLEKRLDSIIMDLKKRTYIKQNEHLLSDSDDDDDDDAVSVDSKVNSIASKLSRENLIREQVNHKGKSLGNTLKRPGTSTKETKLGNTSNTVNRIQSIGGMPLHKQ